MRRRTIVAAAAVVGVAALVAQSLAAAATTTPPAVTTAAVATGSTAVVDLGGAGWKVLTSATATQSGGQISTPGFSTAGWLNVANDGAGAPGTEIAALLQNGSC